jgi:hypothetical protein
LYQVWKTSMQKLGDKIFPSDKWDRGFT